MINTATYILNRSGVSGIEGKSPYEVWLGKKPNLKHLRIIGSTCFAHIPKQCRKKMDKKAVKGILIGYDNDDGYRIWNKETKKLIRSRDVTFDENIFNAPGPVILQEEIEEVENKEKICQERRETILESEDKNILESEDQNILESEDQNYISKSYKNGEEIPMFSQEECVRNECQKELRNRAEIRKPERFEDYVMLVVDDILERKEPLSYQEAMRSSERNEWLLAMEKEMESLWENRTWVLEKLPSGKKPIACKWVYKIKSNPDGSIEKMKARLVIKGYSQKKGEDYDQTFSPVAKSSTIRAILSIAASEDMILTQFDVCTAFLYGELEEDIFMKQPEGYEDGTDRVCRLQRSLYGLKQAPRCWNKRFADFIIKQGFKKSDSDPCLFVKKSGQDMLLMALYVDDGLLASNNDDCSVFTEFLVYSHFIFFCFFEFWVPGTNLIRYWLLLTK